MRQGLKEAQTLLHGADEVKATLCSNTDWPIIAETRGEVAADVLDSAKTDHSIITTVHAKGAMNILSRLIPMFTQEGAIGNHVYVEKGGK
ncbi:ATPase, T2SS/T4P/T4SS family [Lysinibacillus fusiformis]|uniref:ATPase, T2SS/T4P/T4SS family n=1 Tax=Lysinibacillus fusiformis TaxID=28031 RepID=UPI003D06031F